MKTRYLFLGSALVSSLWAVETPVCPQGSEAMLKKDGTTQIRYCGTESADCEKQETLERVFFMRGTRKACAILEGPAVYTYPDKSSLILRYQKGKLSGLSESYDLLGQKTQEENYVDGKRQGKRREWYSENKALKTEEVYNNGKRNGHVQWWYQSGKLKRHAIYKDGKPEGECEDFYENGKKMRLSHFVEGKWSGSFAEWYSDGKKFSEGNYKNGVLEKIRYFDKTGKDVPNTAAPRSLASLPGNGEPVFYADFDANGFLDAVIPHPEEKITEVRFLGEQGLLKSEKISELDLELYNARAVEGQFGEPPTARDGLVLWGRDNGASSVYLYDFDKGVFVRTDHASDSY
jgi:hypothetical protein